MEEKTEYKLCPYCKSIYIPIENYCCKHCYEKSFIIRRDVYAQIQSKNKKGSNSIIKLQHDEEFESRKELLRCGTTMWTAFWSRTICRNTTPLQVI